MSPELLDPETFGLKEGRPTTESDCYALGMTIYEVLSGQMPFTILNIFVVCRKVLDGKRPERPQGDDGRYFTDDVWGVVERCWEHQPRDRISAKAILLGLKGGPLPPRPPSTTGGGTEIESDNQSDTAARDSGMFSPFHPRPISDYPHPTMGLPIAHGNNELPFHHEQLTQRRGGWRAPGNRSKLLPGSLKGVDKPGDTRGYVPYILVASVLRRECSFLREYLGALFLYLESP